MTRSRTNVPATPMSWQTMMDDVSSFQAHLTVRHRESHPRQSLAITQTMKLWYYITQTILATSNVDHSEPSQSQHSIATMSTPNTTIYFGYGSNLWRHQMEQRCPTSEYLGIARLNNYKWIINERGYANVVQLDVGKQQAYEHEVWGLVYTLQPSDEKRLDRNEGVPVAYTKENLTCDFWPSMDPETTAGANVSTRPKEVDMLVYINRDMIDDDKPKVEYIYRMNMGIKDALKEGVPKAYVDKVMRRFIPDVDEEEGDGEVVRVARKQALEFEDET